MKKKLASQLSEFDVHAFTNIVQETVTQSEHRLEKNLKSYIDQRLEEQSQTLLKQMDVENGQQTDELTKLIDKKNREQTNELTELMDKKNQEQTDELVQLVDSKNREQTDEICGVIRDVMDTSDKLYVSKDEFNKHTTNARAHQKVIS